MSKVSDETLQTAVAAVLAASKAKPRKFLETIELQVGFKNYDPNKEKRFSGSVVLPHVPRPKFSVCIIGNQVHVDAAQAIGVDSKTQDDLKLLNKEKKKVKKLAEQYHAFLSSSSIIRLIPRLLGPGLNKAGKFPAVLNANDDVAEKVHEQKCTVKFHLKSKKSLCLGVAVANVGMAPADIITNIVMALNFLASLLPKNWQQIKRVHIKSTMGPSQRIYGM